MEVNRDKKLSRSSGNANQRKAYPVDASQYELLEEVGRGVGSVIRRARCIPFNTFVAIKSLDINRCNINPVDIEREIQAMHLIEHPNVMKSYCSFVVEKNLWVVLPYMAGGSCLDIMKFAYSKGFQEPIIAFVLREILKALDYLHQLGHIHCNVKAGNIFIDNSGIVKLGDAACTFESTDREQFERFVGVPSRMASGELNQPGYDSKADIWSIGITALELAHGRAPLSTNPPEKVVGMPLQNTPYRIDFERDKHYSTSFKEMITMCLKDPKHRPTAKMLMKHSFFKHALPTKNFARTIQALPLRWQRFNLLKITEVDCLAQKNVPYDEQCKAQSALVGIGHFSEACDKSDSDGPKLKPLPSSPYSEYDLNITQKAKNEIDAGDEVMHVRSEMSLPSSQNSKAAKSVDDIAGTNGAIITTFSSGQLNVYEDNPDLDRHRRTRAKKNINLGANQNEHFEREDSVVESGTDSSSDLKSADSKGHEEGQSARVFRRAFDTDYNDQMKENSYKLGAGKVPENLSHAPRFVKTMSLNCVSSLLNEFPGLPRKDYCKDDENLKGLLIQKKGRFSVISHDMELNEQTSSLRKSASVGDGLLEHMNLVDSHANFSQSFHAVLNASIIMSQLQILLNQTSIQQKLIMSLVSNMTSSEENPEKLNAYFSSVYGGKSVAGSSVVSSEDSLLMGQRFSDKEKDLLAQIAELRNRLATLAEELHIAKSRNEHLERQINARTRIEEHATRG